MPTIRPETLEDVDSIRNVNEQAFGGKEEAEIVEKLRNRAALTVSLVAVQNNDRPGSPPLGDIDEATGLPGLILELPHRG